MNTVRIGVSSREEIARRVLRAVETGEPQGSYITFESPEALWKTLTPRRWDILRALTGAGPLSIREAARRVGRDVKAVHGDVHALIDSGVVDKTDDGKIVFPYDAVHVDFMLNAA